MARKRKRRLPRGSQQNNHLTGINDNDNPTLIKSKPGGTYYYDLDVPLVMLSPGTHTATKKKKRLSISSLTPKMWRGTTEQHRVLVQRLRNTGYSTIAFSHTVHGSALLDPVRDGAMRTIPPSIVEDLLYGTSPEKKEKKKRKRNDAILDGDDENFEKTTSESTTSSDTGTPNQNRLGITILRRLNVIIEQPSDLTRYSSNPIEASLALIQNSNQTAPNLLNHKNALDSYDIIALIPLNDESFTSACNSTTTLHSDIITLDYTKGRGGIQLPYKMRAADIRGATRRGIVFEVSYGPALIDPSKRRALVRAARLVSDVFAGVREPHPPRIIMSSGSRRRIGGGDEKIDGDVGVMALRSPGDMKNLAGIVLGWDDVLVSKIMSEHPQMVVMRGHNRRLGRTVVESGVSMGIGKTTSVAFSVSIAGKRGSGRERLVAGEVGLVADSSIVENNSSPGSMKVGYSIALDTQRVTVKEDENGRGDSENFEVGDGLIRLP